MTSEPNVFAGENETPVRRLRRARGKTKRSYYAIKASRLSVQLPRAVPAGFLTQARLFKLAKEGDVSALQSLWLMHARLAYTVANRYRLPPQDVADAIQSALIGLRRAIHLFDLGRETEFSTYAYHWLRQAILRHRSYQQYFIAIPAHLYADFCRFNREIDNAMDRVAWFESRARWLEEKSSTYEITRGLYRLANPVSLRKPLPAKGARAVCPLHALLTKERAELIDRALARLPDRERLILILRYGLKGNPELTLEEVGARLRLTRERVRQIQVIAEARIRSTLCQVTPEFAKSLTGEPEPEESENASGSIA
jgi:RNA polymerase primary sigma factor